MSAFFSLTWDASPHGWAAVVPWWGEDVTEQPNRACMAALLALEAAAAAGCKGVLCAPPERRGGGGLRRGSMAAQREHAVRAYAAQCALVLAAER